MTEIHTAVSGLIKGQYILKCQIKIIVQYKLNTFLNMSFV